MNKQQTIAIKKNVSFQLFPKSDVFVSSLTLPFRILAKTVTIRELREIIAHLKLVTCYMANIFLIGRLT